VLVNRGHLDQRHGRRSDSWRLPKHRKPKQAVGLQADPALVRSEIGDILADTKPGRLLREEGGVLPVYPFPRDDVRTHLLWSSQNRTSEAHYGLASYRRLEVGGETAGTAVGPTRPPRDSKASGSQARQTSRGRR
jgi:uncharacterized protein (DUF427 family)